MLNNDCGFVYVAQKPAFDIIILRQTLPELQQGLHIPNEEIERRFRAGDLCFVAKDGDKLIGSLWGHSGDIYVRGVGKRFEIGPHGVYLYGIYTMPEERQRNVFNSLRDAFFQYYQKQGVNFFFALVHPDNSIMLRALGKLGFKVRSSLTYVRLQRIGLLHEKLFNDKKSSIKIVFREPKDCFVL